MTLTFLALQGAPYIYDISRLRVKLYRGWITSHKDQHTLSQCRDSNWWLQDMLRLQKLVIYDVLWLWKSWTSSFVGPCTNYTHSMYGHLKKIGCSRVHLWNKTLCHSPHTSLKNISAAVEVQPLNKPIEFHHLQEFPLSATLVDGSTALNINQAGR
jgi:hypothetical protein